ncbi:SrfA family protein [Erwinia sp. 198]|uniref:SrfA family protein n=1 Tax=Erwinia sp. 198 TaxID=2022746 RepID=UPI000F677200|nr:SrfA family protein [Erwinia sp. 198]RRZ95582.1 virulence effector protein [Erwinia sp. 198]
MAKLFLRSGSLDAVLPLGENGQPVYLSALQLRETLRLRKQQQIADCLAIPQPNDAGDRLDWYSPISGKVISWAAASDSARAHALNQLVACQQTVADLCQRALQSDKNSQKLFGALLAKAIQFPDQNFVYLVGGKPVLTFWGFVSLEKKGQLDPLDCLRAVEEEAPLTLSKMTAAAPVVAVAPAVSATPAAAAVTPAAAPAIAAYQTSAEPENTPEPPPAASAPVKPKPVKNTARQNLLRYGWILPAAALLVVFGVQMKNYFSAMRQEVTASPTANVNAPKPAVAPEKAAADRQQPATEPAKQTTETKPAADAIKQPAETQPVAEQDAVLPVAPASVAAVAATPTQTAAEATPAPVAQPPAVPAGKDDLVLPTNAVKLGSTRFLNGNWRVIVGIKTPLTGKPPVLRYQLRNGKGQAQMTQGDGTVCRVEVYAGVMKSGNLVINSRTRAKCSDGSRYHMPELTCVQGAEGTAAACSGQYDADTVLPMTMKRESK